MRHIGGMQIGDDVNKRIDTALLSAAMSADGTNPFVAATQNICGIPFISLQIRRLQTLGIKHFLIEAEQLSGAFLAATDDLKARGIEIDVIRSPGDLAQATSETERLLVLAPGLHVETSLLAEILERKGQLLATVDGREDNAAFERIDLNTRWSGIAIVGRVSLKEIASLPEGWSLTSAILRSALQAEVEQHFLEQKTLENKEIKIINDIESVKNLTAMELQKAGAMQTGFIESTLYAPLANWAMMKLPFGLGWPSIAAIAFSALALLTGFFGLLWLSASAAIVAILLLTAARNLLEITEDRSDRILSTISWCLLLLAMMLTIFQFGGAGAAFAAAVAAALLRYSGKLSLPPDRMILPPSPALLSWTLLAAATVGEITYILQMFAALQLATLLYIQTFEPKRVTELNRP